jgi:hypothetical protein
MKSSICAVYKVLVGTMISASVFAPTAAWASSVSKTIVGDLTVYSSGQPEQVLVLFPGAFIAPERYQGLAEALVNASHGQVEVAVAQFSGGFANPIQATGRIDQAMALLAKQGYSDVAARTFVGGHSAGGIAGHPAVFSKKLGGLVLLGSYLPHSAVFGASLTTYERPVLTLGGELDGLTGVNYLARDSRALGLLAERDSAVVATKPVIVIRGSSHMQFADGGMLAGDMKPEKDINLTHSEAADIILNFMAANSTLSAPSVRESASASLVAQVAATKLLLQPLLTAWDKTDSVCKNSQRLVAPLASDGWNQLGIVTRVYDRQSQILRFIADKSAVRILKSGMESSLTHQIEIPVYVENPPDPLDISTDHYLASPVLACKMRTLPSIAKETGLTPRTDDAKACAELNVIAIREALALLDGTPFKDRLTQKFGDPTSWNATHEPSGDDLDAWRYGPITVRSESKASGQSWVSGKFAWTKTSSVSWQLDTVELITGTDVFFKPFAGAHYCKIISPLKVVEWATLIGLKN